MLLVLGKAPSPDAHCLDIIPQVKLTYPADGMSIQEVNYVDFGAVFIDTFYRDELKSELLAQYAKHEYAAFAYVDSIRYFLVLDSIFYEGELSHVDTLRGEGLWITLHSQLKGAPLPKQIYAEDSLLVYVADLPLATSYTGYLDTPFVAFFDRYAKVSDMNFGPVDGCYFEPRAYMMPGGGITKKGEEGVRMPGVSVAGADFLKAVGKEGFEVPQVRPRHTSIRRARGGSAFRFHPEHGRLSLPVYDIKGRRRASPRGKSGASAESGTLPPGIYFLRPRTGPIREQAGGE